VDLPGRDVTGRSQRSHYIRVKVVYVVRPLGLFLALQCMSFPLLQALSTVRLVTLRVGVQTERRGVSGGCPDALRVLKALKVTNLKPPTPPDGQNTVT
jgi:hypothetical protein